MRKKCPICGKNFQDGYDRRRKFCSVECAGIAVKAYHHKYMLAYFQKNKVELREKRKLYKEANPEYISLLRHNEYLAKKNKKKVL